MIKLCTKEIDDTKIAIYVDTNLFDDVKERTIGTSTKYGISVIAIEEKDDIDYSYIEKCDKFVDLNHIDNFMCIAFLSTNDEESYTNFINSLDIPYDNIAVITDAMCKKESYKSNAYPLLLESIANLFDKNWCLFALLAGSSSDDELNYMLNNNFAFVCSTKFINSEIRDLFIFTKSARNKDYLVKAIHHASELSDDPISYMRDVCNFVIHRKWEYNDDDSNVVDFDYSSWPPIFRTFILKKKTMIVSAFPCTGKSTFVNQCTDLLLFDSDSSSYSWINKDDGTRERNPEFPNNYINRIKECIGDYDIIFVSSHETVRKALAEAGINYILIYPRDKTELLLEYVNRATNRGSSLEFIRNMANHWDEWIKSCDEDESAAYKIPLASKEATIGNIMHAVRLLLCEDKYNNSFKGGKVIV